MRNFSPSNGDSATFGVAIRYFWGSGQEK